MHRGFSVPLNPLMGFAAYVMRAKSPTLCDQEVSVKFNFKSKLRP